MRRSLLVTGVALMLATGGLAACDLNLPGTEGTDETAPGDGTGPDISGEAPDPGLPGDDNSREPAETEAPADTTAGGKNPTAGEAPAPRETSGGTASEAPAEFARLISGYLDTYASELASGYSPASGLSDQIVGLNAGGEHDWSVQLRRGVDYRIVGACDNECNDVDLILLDAQGREVDSDLLTDDYPIVTVRPGSDSRYTVRIRLVTCTIEPCYVGARVLQQ